MKPTHFIIFILLFLLNTTSAFCITFSFDTDSIKLKEANRKKMLPLEKMLDSVKIGNTAPDFRFISSKGDSVQLSSFKGKIVVLDFWATWCPPCIKQFKYCDSLEEKFKDKDIVFLSISIDQKKKTWENFMSKRNLNGIQLWAAGSQQAYYYTLMDYKTMQRADPISANSTEAKKMVASGITIVDGVPGNFVIIDRAGKIRNTWLLPSEGSTMEDQLKELLKE